VTPSIADRFFNYDGPQVREEAGEARFLADRPDSDWAALVQRTETRRYSAGQTIIAAGDRDQALYLLTQGVVGVVLRVHKAPSRRSTHLPWSARFRSSMVARDL